MKFPGNFPKTKTQTTCDLATDTIAPIAASESCVKSNTFWSNFAIFFFLSWRNISPPLWQRYPPCCFAASLCPVLPAEPPNQPGTNILYQGDVRLRYPGAVFHGTCLGYLWDPKGAAGTAGGEAPASCALLKARTHYTQRTATGTSFKGSLVLIPDGMVSGTTYYLNMTFAQDITASLFLDVSGVAPSTTTVTGVRANHLWAAVDYDGEAVLELELEFTSLYPEEQLCVYDINCNYASAEELTAKWSVGDSPPFDLAVQQYYDAVVEYECGYGRGFDISGWVSELPKEMAMRCNAEEKWIYEEPAAATALVNSEWDGATMPTCKCERVHGFFCVVHVNRQKKTTPNSGTHCINPLLPDASLKMYIDPTVNQSALFAFSDTVSYFCEDGYFFKDDAEKESESLACNAGLWEGNFTGCVKSEEDVKQILS